MTGLVTPSKKDIANTVYRSLLLAATTMTYSYAFAKMVGMSIKSPKNLNFEELLKLGGIVSVSNVTLDYLIKEGIIPENIVN
jgi:hypothetical protein